MDISPEYIKQCEKAKEIQEACCRSLPLENLFFIKKLGALSLYDSERFQHDWYSDRIWLPRQDQLQEMVKYRAGDALHRICEFHDIICPDWKYFLIFTSLEQLWLAFVMKERWNKIWNGKEWI